jgi:hypothetical protein
LGAVVMLLLGVVPGVVPLVREDPGLGDGVGCAAAGG